MTPTLKADVIAYLRAVTHAVSTAKDFRTWGGTRIAAETALGPRARRLTPGGRSTPPSTRRRRD
jgi:DNA topoisomerase IB